MKATFLPTLGALALSSLLPAAGMADTRLLTGDTTGAPTFNRPTETGALSSQEAVPYNVFQVNVAANGLYNFSLTSNEAAGVYDTYVHLYLGGFNAGAPDLNFFRANDDATFNSPDGGSALSNLSLLAASTYYLVADGFLNTDYGSYTAVISGPGAITVGAVPEPSSLALFGSVALGGAGVFWARRRHRRTGTAAA